MHCANTTFAYHNEFSEYITVEGETLEDTFDYLFDVGIGKILSERGKKYLLEFFVKRDIEHL